MQLIVAEKDVTKIFSEIQSTNKQIVIKHEIDICSVIKRKISNLIAYLNNDCIKNLRIRNFWFLRKMRQKSVKDGQAQMCKKKYISFPLERGYTCNSDIICVGRNGSIHLRITGWKTKWNEFVVALFNKFNLSYFYEVFIQEVMTYFIHLSSHRMKTREVNTSRTCHYVLNECFCKL